MNAGKHLVLAGAGHAHLQTIRDIQRFVRKGHRVTVVGPDIYHYYSGMGPGALGGTYREDQIRFDSRRMTEMAGGHFVQDRVEAIDADGRQILLESGHRLVYDLLSLNLGSVVANRLESNEGCEIYPVKPIVNLVKARRRILQWRQSRPLEMVVVGGGNSAAEIAGNLVQLLGEKAAPAGRIAVVCRSAFLGRSSSRVRNYASGFLTDQGVRIIEGDAVLEARAGAIVTERGERIDADLVFAAQGIVAPPLIRRSGLPVGDDGGLRVNRYLQCSAHPNIFAGGDCACFTPQPLAKVGVYAVRQNRVLCENLMRMLEGRSLLSFSPGGKYLLIYNLGGGVGALEKGWFFWGGRAAFWLKDRIDRRFMALHG